MASGNKSARKNLPKKKTKKGEISAKTLKRYKLFVAEWIIDFNGTRAAIAAGFSRKTAYSIGHELLKKPEVLSLIDNAIRERNERLKVDADWVLKRLIDETTADLADLFNDDGTIRAINEWPEVWRQGLVAGVDVFEEYAGRGENRERIGQTVKIKLSDRIKRIELIGKHINVQAFRDQVKNEVPGLREVLAAVAGTSRGLPSGEKPGD